MTHAYRDPATIVKTVYKYDIPFEDNPSVEMPQGAEVLSFAEQDGELRVWAMVDPEAPLERRRFRLAGTGHPLERPDELRFVGTIFLRGGALVFHLFERRPTVRPG